MFTYDRVHFDGAWGEEDRAAVTEAISVAEGRRGASSAHFFGKTWVCIREGCDEKDAFYFASRFGLYRVLSARTAAELAEKISELGHPVSAHAGP